MIFPARLEGSPFAHYIPRPMRGVRYPEDKERIKARSGYVLREPPGEVTLERTGLYAWSQKRPVGCVSEASLSKVVRHRLRCAGRHDDRPEDPVQAALPTLNPSACSQLPLDLRSMAKSGLPAPAFQ
jgi:hypothetical protein